MRLLFLWLLLALALTAFVQADEAETPAPTSKANARDNDPAIQEIGTSRAPSTSCAAR
jgi:hypothetical protein